MLAIHEHIQYLSKLPQHKNIEIAQQSYPVSWLKKSAEEFLSVVDSAQSPEQLSISVQKQFNIFQASGRQRFQEKQMLVTGYYEPLLEGSLKREPPFLYPLYSVPDDLITLSIDSKPAARRKTTNGDLVTYWSREEIEEQDLLAGYELVYLKDPVDVFSLHVQGSGKIHLQNGKVQSIRYAGSNGRNYRSIGKLLVDRGIMVKEEVTMPKIRQYLADHPEELKSVLYHNKKYIFFSWAPTNKPPRGSSGATLTPERSIAIDPETLPMGSIGYLVTKRPVVGNDGKITSWVPFHQFVLPQDSGSAIKGAGRVDVFWGNGKYAKTAAGAMKEDGKLFFLVKKGHIPDLRE